MKTNDLALRVDSSYDALITLPAAVLSVVLVRLDEEPFEMWPEVNVELSCYVPALSRLEPLTQVTPLWPFASFVVILQSEPDLTRQSHKAFLSVCRQPAFVPDAEQVQAPALSLNGVTQDGDCVGNQCRPMCVVPVLLLNQCLECLVNDGETNRTLEIDFVELVRITLPSRGNFLRKLLEAFLGSAAHD